MTKRLIYGLIVVWMFVTLSNCGNGSNQTEQSEKTEETDGTTSEDITGSDQNSTEQETTQESVSFQIDVAEGIFRQNCTRSGCHGGNSSAAGLSLNPNVAYENIVSVPSTEVSSVNRIEPGDPSQSYLFLKVTGNQTDVGGSGATMPLGGSLTEQEIQTLEKWILDGALDN